MEEWVIFQTPSALLLFIAALGLALFELITKSTKGILTLVSAALSLAAAAVLVINGGSLWECAALLTVFLLVLQGVKR